MIEQLESYMQSEYNYKVGEVKKIAPIIKKRSNIVVFAGVFLLIVVIYVLTQSFPWWVLPIAFVVILGLYFVFRKPAPIESLIFTPDYVIHEYREGAFIAINYDEITSFSVEENTLIIRTESKTVQLDASVYQKELEPLIDILEAKGKTFDSTKEYMIRPVKIHIEDDEVKITDIDVVTSTQKLISKYINSYEMLTPGFIEYIVFLNSNITDVEYSESNLILNIDRLEVHEGHPENTTFDSIVVDDCIFIIEDIDFRSCIIRDSKTDTINDLKPTKEHLEKHLKNGVITEWNFEDNTCDIVILEGVHQLKLQFDYEELIVGWNSIV